MPHAPAKPGGININGIDFLVLVIFSARPSRQQTVEQNRRTSLWEILIFCTPWFTSSHFNDIISQNFPKGGVSNGSTA
jgi:hypothetical protein